MAEKPYCQGISHTPLSQSKLLIPPRTREPQFPCIMLDRGEYTEKILLHLEGDSSFLVVFGLEISGIG
jgi:hypothetical protein